MAIRYPAPTEHTLEALFAGTVTVPTHVTRGQASDPDRNTLGLFAEFVTDDDEVAALAFADHEAVNYVGGALALIDVDTVQDASQRKTLNDAGAEKFREFMDPFSSCLNSDFTKNVKLRTVEHVGANLSEDARHLWGKPHGRRAFRVAVDDYGAGALILYLA